MSVSARGAEGRSRTVMFRLNSAKPSAETVRRYWPGSTARNGSPLADPVRTSLGARSHPGRNADAGAHDGPAGGVADDAGEINAGGPAGCRDQEKAAPSGGFIAWLGEPAQMGPLEMAGWQIQLSQRNPIVGNVTVKVIWVVEALPDPPVPRQAFQRNLDFSSGRPGDGGAVVALPIARGRRSCASGRPW